MIKRLIEISRDPVHLSVKLEQLVVQPFDSERAAAKSIPCEDIGVVLIDHPQVTLTHQALSTLMQHGAAVVVCGREHLPAGILIPISSHTETLWRVQDQVQTTLPTKKRLWQQIVVAKIKAQAAALLDNTSASGMLEKMALEVKSGDADNVEAQAAKLYWSAWLGETPGDSSATESHSAAPLPAPGAAQRLFRRDPEGLDPLNAMLNYGYAVLRAALARALVSAGLFPALGIHHSHRSNAFALADDVIEPLRPLVDVIVRERYRAGSRELDQSTKAALLSVLHQSVMFGGESGPLMVVLHRYTASLHRCLTGNAKRLEIPVKPPHPK